MQWIDRGCGEPHIWKLLAAWLMTLATVVAEWCESHPACDA
jgi:hypothetical protein